MDTNFLYTATAIRKIPPAELCRMLDEGDPDRFEKCIRQIEDAILDGPFSVEKIEKSLQTIAFSEKLDAVQKGNIDILHNNPFRDAIVGVFNELGMQDLANTVETDQQSQPDALSLSEKKNYYQEAFDRITGTINALKSRLIKMRKTPKNHRLASLLERCENCENEISRTRDVVRRF